LPAVRRILALAKEVFCPGIAGFAVFYDICGHNWK